MTILFNHTIVPVRDNAAAAQVYADVLGLPELGRYGPFRVLQLANGAALDFMDVPGPFEPRHYAFFVDEAEFDAIRERIVERELPYWADPHQARPGEVNTDDGGRGLYW